ncbi:MAG: ATP-binding protein [bacterium]
MSPPASFERFYLAFRDVSSSVHSSASLKEVLDTVVRKATEVLGAKGAIVRILNLETHQLEIGAAYGLSRRYLSKGPVSSEKIITDLCRVNKVILIRDILNSPQVQYPKEAWEEGIRAILDVPLKLREHVVGIIRVHFGRPRTFSDEELDFVISIGEQCAVAMDKARLIENQQAQYRSLSLQTEKLSALGRMAAGIAHEINNPLGGILIYSTNLLKKVPGEGPLKEGLEIIVHETIRCRSIIQELLEFSRERPPERAQAGINEVIEKTLCMLENGFRLHHIRLRKDLAPDLPQLSLDVNQMQQVFVNLLMNASEAVRRDGEIAVRSSADPGRGRVLVEIRDTGCGIPPQNMERIFEPFFSTKEKGTGLGLAVSYGIVKNHQGTIRVESEPGKGACFRIEIPIQGSPQVFQDPEPLSR